MCRKMQFFSFSFFDGPLDPLKSITPPPKMVPSYSLVIWLPKTPKSHWSPVAPSSRKLWFSEDTQFWPKYSNGPGVTKSWQISKVTIRCHKTCLKLSWVKFDQKIPMGSVPNCRKEIANRYPIRWFKCKLKPPKNHFQLICITTKYFSILWTTWSRQRTTTSMQFHCCRCK